jgi:hypothetical protein
MFCDMVDFTELSGKVGSEDAYSAMDQVYEILIHQELPMLRKRPSNINSRNQNLELKKVKRFLALPSI